MVLLLAGTLLVGSVAVVVLAPRSRSAPVTGIYGPAVGMDSLNNTVVGGPLVQLVSYRFRATISSKLVSARIYVVGANHQGYGAGTGGAWQVSVQTDDGTAAHAPSAVVLATASLSPPDGFPLIEFSSPPSLVEGRLYHLVFQNVDPSPTDNYASLDGVFMYQPTSPRMPGVADTDWGQMVRRGDAAWADVADTVPILQVSYGDGVSAGLGYMESWVRSPQTVSGADSVREAFTVAGADRLVSAFSVRLMRVSGTAGALSARLETDRGTPVAEATVAASAIPIGIPGDHDGTGHATWVTFPFAEQVVLHEGQAYHIVLTAPAGSVYSAFAIRKGVDYGFDTTTFFADGHGQVTTGGGWGPFTQDGGGPLDEGDLQFYFR